MIDSARDMLGLIGNVMSLSVFLMQGPAIFYLIRQGRIEDFELDQHALSCFSCLIWMVYGLPYVTEDNLWITMSYGGGLLVEIMYLSAYGFHCPRHKLVRLLLYLIGEIFMVAAIIGGVWPVFHTLEGRQTVFGFIGVILHLLDQRKAFTSCRTEFSYRVLCYSIACFVHGIIWLLYSLLKMDLYILGISSLRALSSLVKFLVLICPHAGPANSNNTVVATAPSVNASSTWTIRGPLLFVLNGLVFTLQGSGAALAAIIQTFDSQPPSESAQTQPSIFARVRGWLHPSPPATAAAQHSTTNLHDGVELQPLNPQSSASGEVTQQQLHPQPPTQPSSMMSWIQGLFRQRAGA